MNFLALLNSMTLAAAAALSRRDFSFNETSYSPNDIIRRDIAVIGGGAAGTFAAVKAGDMGKSAVIVEKQGHLGGHTHTYMDPDTGKTVDYGVRAYANIPVVTDFFGRFNLPLTKFAPPRTTTVHADFSSGELLSDFAPDANLTAYTAQLEKYPYLNTGFNQLVYPIPSDLLLPFSEFITKYELQNIAYTIYTYLYGTGNVLQQLAINIIQSLGLAQLGGFTGGSLTTAKNNNQALYDAAQGHLGSNVLLNSTVVAALRPSGKASVALVAKTPSGFKLILVSQLLITIPTIPANMAPFFPDAKENTIFSEFSFSSYWVGLVSNTNLAPNTSFVNTGASTAYNIPSFGEVYSLTPTAVPGVYAWGYGSDNAVTVSTVQAAVASVIQKLNGTSTTEFVVTADHTPSKIVAPADAISNGFYRDLFALNGYRNTWYTGAQFLDSSSGIWNYTQQAILGPLVAACR